MATRSWLEGFAASPAAEGPTLSAALTELEDEMPSSDPEDRAVVRSIVHLALAKQIQDLTERFVTEVDLISGGDDFRLAAAVFVLSIAPNVWTSLDYMTGSLVAGHGSIHYTIGLNVAADHPIVNGVEVTRVEHRVGGEKIRRTLAVLTPRRHFYAEQRPLWALGAAECKAEGYDVMYVFDDEIAADAFGCARQILARMEVPTASTTGEA